MITHKTLLADLPRLSEKQNKALLKLGLKTVEDLLLYFPFRYDDYSEIVPISEEYIGQTVTVIGKITKAKINRIFKRRMSIVEIFIEDDNGMAMRAIWFNQPYLLDNFKIGNIIRLSGKIVVDRKHLSMTGPSFENASREATNTGCVVPVYSETAGITSKWLRWKIKTLMEYAKNIGDTIPEETRKKLHLFSLEDMIEELHFPKNQTRLAVARKSLAFREMFLLQLKSLQLKNDWDKNRSAIIKFNEKLIKDFIGKLPFKLTNAQKKASFEILKDLEKSHPMNRLLNGDVGSGKTIVAAISALQTVSAGYQVAILAPTEVLARQHFEGFCKIFENYNFNIALLTNSYKLIYSNHSLPYSGEMSRNRDREGFENQATNRDKLLEDLADGRINITIGTHALIQKDIRFKNLALVIVDEQHRFGVEQRATLQKETANIEDGLKTTIPHLLSMSATPIPRTLAIAYFGSLDISLLDEMPKNRKKIITKIVTGNDIKNTYAFVEREILSGHQAFIIFPFVEESKAMTEIKAATEEHARLSKDVFPELQLGLLHGRMKSKEKEKIMLDFKNKKIDILISTSVVEVGIDIPNATVIMIENAERFGLAQLHQFRGRVGRGEFQSYCFLFCGNGEEKTPQRLKVLEKNNDGFMIAQKDLELRGPGTLFGKIQSGLPDITMENLANVKLIKLAQEEAEKILTEDFELKKHPALKNALSKFSEGKIHME